MAALVATHHDTPARTDDLHNEPDIPASRISAYYSLVFPNFTYYLQTLNVAIGRRCVPASAASTSDNPQVDVDLGPLKSVSRLHAKIEYEEEEERFVLIVLGRNGAWVDGVWSGSGSKVPLSDRSQIQIASRTFHFNLPPPPAPEDSPSPSSHSSDNRARSRSLSVDIVDITSISPPSSLPPCSPPCAPVSPSSPPPKISLIPEPSLPNSNSINRFKSNVKKRKKSDASVHGPPPELIAPKPPFTYAQLCYRAIKALGGKASLQDICQWIKETYEWYRHCAKDWESSVRHNLSSNPGFKKLLRSKDEKGKGALWQIDPQHEHTFEEQDAKRQAQAQGASTGGKDGRVGGKKGKVPLDPPFTRSVKGDFKGTPLPPPLTTIPLALKTTPTSMPFTTSSFPGLGPSVKQEPSNSDVPPSTSTQLAPASAGGGLNVPTTTPVPATSVSTPSPLPTLAPSSTFPAIPTTVRIPIVVGPVPPAASSPDAPAATPKPIVLHDNTLILNPEIFAHLTPTHLRDLEALGAQKALEILQSYIVRYYKEKLKAEGGRGRGRGRARRARGAGPGGTGRPDTSQGPFTNAPLPPRMSQTPAPAPGGPYAASPGFGGPSYAPASAPPPMASLQPPVESAPSPIVVIDDDPPEAEDGPAAKRRRLEDALGSS